MSGHKAFSDVSEQVTKRLRDIDLEFLFDDEADAEQITIVDPTVDSYDTVWMSSDAWVPVEDWQ